MLPHKHKLILYIFHKRLYSHRRSFFSASLEFFCVTQPSCQFPVDCTFDSHSTLNKKVHEASLASFACKVFTKHYSGLVQLAARPSLMASSRPEKLDSDGLIESNWQIVCPIILNALPPLSKCLLLVLERWMYLKSKSFRERPGEYISDLLGTSQPRETRLFGAAETPQPGHRKSCSQAF